jgi:hypothetical protein
MTRSRSFRDAVAQHFKNYPDQWIAAVDFERVGGRQAWRTRISECRTELQMEIEWRGRRVKRCDGSTIILSEYKYCAPTGQLALL